MRYAIIKDGTVVNVVLASAEIATQSGWVECPNAGPGWTYADGVFAEPAAVEPVAQAAPTKEQMMAELAALTAKIQALE